MVCGLALCEVRDKGIAVREWCSTCTKPPTSGSGIQKDKKRAFVKREQRNERTGTQQKADGPFFQCNSAGARHAAPSQFGAI